MVRLCIQIKILMALGILSWMGSAAWGQSASAPAAEESLANYLPAETGFYFRVQDRSGWQQLLQRLGTAGAALGVDPVAGRDSALGEFLANSRVVVAARNWQDRRGGLTLVIPQDPQPFEKALMLKEEERQSGPAGVRVYKTPRKLWIATNGLCFIFSEVGQEGTLFQQCLPLLAGLEGARLADVPAFNDLGARVESAALGWIYWAGSADSNEGAAGAAMIQLAGQELRCRIWLKEPQRVRSGHVDAEQLRWVPDGAAAVLMTSTDTAAWLQKISGQSKADATPFYWHVARGLLEAEVTGALTSGATGPQVTLLLRPGDKHRETGIGVIIRAPQAAEVMQLLTQLLPAVCANLNAHPSAGTATNWQFHKEGEENAPWYRLENPAPESTTFRQFGLAQRQGQLLLASPAELLPEMLVAGEKPAGEWRTRVGAHHPEAPSAAGLVVALQPQAALAGLAPLRVLLADEEGLLENEWYQTLRDYFRDTSIRLGARLAKDNPRTPGKVYVISVREDHSASGLLQPGDYIVGIDGQMLTLRDSRADLRRRLEDPAAGRQRVLRLERGGLIRDVPIALPEPTYQSFHGLLTDTRLLLDFLSALGASVSWIEYTQVGDEQLQFGNLVITLAFPSSAPSTSTRQ
ncbi:MAG: hypothetical protein HJJLKODD_02509 [Phycisphaerae bacterium]|nr:hypothetical protein [Phycisphaerae bacterium]